MGVWNSLCRTGWSWICEDPPDFLSPTQDYKHVLHVSYIYSYNTPLQSPCIDYLILTLHFFLMYFRNLSLCFSLCFRKALWRTLCVDLYACVCFNRYNILKSTFNRWASKKLISKKKKGNAFFGPSSNKGINLYVGFYYRFVLFCFTQWRKFFPIYSVLLIFPISLISLVLKLIIFHINLSKMKYGL